ncbi:MAG: class I SAM-dependent methyltransferase [Bacteroidia bacterium]
MSAASLWHRFNSCFRYLFSASSRHGIHSPFMYEFYCKVLLDMNYYPVYNSIARFRHSLEHDESWLSKKELGAGSNAGLTTRRLLRKEAKHSGIPADYGRLLYRIVRHFQPRYALELGTSLGLSAFYQAAAMAQNSGSEFVSIEGCSDTHQAATRNLNAIAPELGIDHFVQFRLGDFNDELPKVLKEWPRLDYVFIDGDHREERLLHYFRLCLQKVNENSVIAVDDIYWSPGMTRAWQAIKQMPEVRQTADLYRFGLVFFRKSAAPQHFILKF